MCNCYEVVTFFVFVLAGKVQELLFYRSLFPRRAGEESSTVAVSVAEMLPNCRPWKAELSKATQAREESTTVAVADGTVLPYSHPWKAELSKQGYNTG